jgi:hypothetical protein
MFALMTQFSYLYRRFQRAAAMPTGLAKQAKSYMASVLAEQPWVRLSPG